MENKTTKKYFVGYIFTNKYGTQVELLKRDGRIWTVKILKSGDIVDIHASSLQIGSYKTPFCKSVYGVGYYGIGVNTCRDDDDINPIYSVWANMIKRCYTDYKGDMHKKRDHYDKVAVVDEWHNYQVFAEWFKENSVNFLYHKITPKMDKDLLSVTACGTLYSPSTCVLLPNIINCALIESKSTNTSYHGVQFVKGKYFASVMVDYKQLSCGTHITPEAARDSYIEKKKEVIGKLADEYKHVISEVAYSKLKQWIPKG